MEIKGKITKVLDVRQGMTKENKPWMSQEYLIDCEDREGHGLVFTVFGQEKITKLNIKTGQYGTARLATRTREYGGRYYNDIQAWAWELDPTRVQPQ